MKMTSKIFLILSGVLMLMCLVATLFTLILTWSIFGLNLIYNIVISVLLETGGNDGLVTGLLQFATFTSPFKMIINMMVSSGDVEMANDMIIGYFFMESLIEFIVAFVNTIASVILLAVGLTGMIFAFIGSSNKPRQGIHIMNIAFGALCYLYVNVYVGLFMVLGGIFGTIADKRAKREEEEKKQVEERELVPLEA